MEVFLLIVTGIPALVWYGFVQSEARTLTSISTTMDSNEVADLIHRDMRLVWAREPGPGTVNYRARARRRPPTISVDIAAGKNGSEVQIWVSRYDSLLGLIGHAQLVWRTKRRLATKLAD